MKNIDKKSDVKTKIKVNDNIVVINGIDKGRRGKIIHIDRDKGRIIVEGVNKKHKHLKPSQEYPKGGKIQIERWMHISNVMLFCEKCKKGVGIGINVNEKEKSRVCKKCGKGFA